MEKAGKKGTVTSLASMFPPEEAHKASKRVLDTIADRQKELHLLNQYISDNNNIIDLVQRIPEQLHHDVMVPFGKAAFFPGRLIHTNEFLVLLGEGYYVDRTSKQTTDILKRRGNTLESQVESLNAVMQDLKAEASFFNATASEAAEGLVEIREDYIDEASSDTVSSTDNKIVVEDEEYARLLSRMEELEKEELEAENVDGSESDMTESNDQGSQIPLDHMTESNDQGSQISLDHGVKNSEMHLVSDTFKVPKDLHLTKKLDNPLEQDLSNQLDHDTSEVQPASKGLSRTSEHSKVQPTSKVLPRTREPLQVQHALKDGFLNNTRTAIPKSAISDKEQRILPQAPPINEGSVRPSEAQFDGSKAFTGSIVERTHNTDSDRRGQSASGTSKTVSRFKLQRKQH